MSETSELKEINWQPHFLEDELIKLVPLQEDDFERLYKVASDPLIWEQHPANDRYKRDVFQQFFVEGLESKTAFIILDTKSNQPIGSSRFYDYDEKDNSIAIGYTFLAKEYWGGKYNNSLKTLMLDYAFRFVEKVIFHIGKNNIRSQKGTAKFGAKEFEPLIKEEKFKDSLFFELKKDDWMMRLNQAKTTIK